MELLTPEDRVVLWRLAVDSEGAQRSALLHVLSRDVLDALGRLDLGGGYEEFVVETIGLLDEAGLLARDELRRAFEELREREDGAEQLASELSALLREAAGVEHLGVARRVRSVELSSLWRERLLTRMAADPTYLTVAEVAARFSVTPQAVYKWLDKGRISGERRPGGSWRVPASQFEPQGHRRFSEEQAQALRKRLLRLHGGDAMPGDEEIARAARDK